MSADQIRPTIRQLARIAEEMAYTWMLVNEPDADQLALDLREVVAVQAGAAALMAADWYNSADPKSRYAAFRADDLEDVKLANVARWVHAGPQEPENRARQAAHKLVFDAARRTVAANAVNEGVAIARHEQAACCHQCVARATTTAKHRNSSSDGLDGFFHPGCEGMYVPVRGELYAPPDYAKEWHSKVTAARRAGNVTAEDVANWLSAN